MFLVESIMKQLRHTATARPTAAAAVLEHARLTKKWRKKKKKIMWKKWKVHQRKK